MLSINQWPLLVDVQDVGAFEVDSILCIEHLFDVFFSEFVAIQAGQAEHPVEGEPLRPADGVHQLRVTQVVQGSFLRLLFQAGVKPLCHQFISNFDIDCLIIYVERLFVNRILVRNESAIL